MCKKCNRTPCCCKVTLFGRRGTPGATGKQGLTGPAGTTILTPIGTSTTDTTVTPILGGYDIQVDVNFKNSIAVSKLLTDTTQNYFPKVTNTDLFVGYAAYPGASNAIRNWDSKSGTGGFAGAADFDLVKGIWTCPADGHYLVTGLLAYKMNGDFTQKVSDNSHMGPLGFTYWMAGASDIGFISMGFIYSSGSIIEHSVEPMSQKVGSIVRTIKSTVMFFPAGSTVEFLINNYTDVHIFGNSSSSCFMRILNIGK